MKEGEKIVLYMKSGQIFVGTLKSSITQAWVQLTNAHEKNSGDTYPTFEVRESDIVGKTRCL